ncbi:MAG: substrate-binding domain-containing protein [Rhodobacteraceae bacterium]|nr:substrate-binding domain-containing protein [Paracoccaceae bacterium]
MEVDQTLDVTTTVARRAGFDAMADLLGMQIPPSAVFCYNDVLAYGAMLQLRSRGIEIGKEVAIAGFDDLEESSLWSPSLTSVALDRPRLVQQAFCTLTDVTMEDGQVNIAISPSVVLRNSTQLWSIE